MTMSLPLPPFKPSRPLTLGVELELQIINLSDFDLSPSCSYLLSYFEKQEFPGTVTPEMTEAMIEIATDAHDTYEGILRQLGTIRDTLVQAADHLNLGLCGGGSHPFQNWADRRIFDKPRFRQLSDLYGYLAKQFTIFGQHIHIGCPSGDDALYLLHALNRYVPQFIALSASSPFVQGNDTLFHSARLNSVFAFPLSGRAPFLLSWDDFVGSYFKKMETTGVVKSMKDFYWDIRPKPEYGTIELRVCDTPLTIEHAAALAGYLQALCKFLLEKNEPAAEEDDYLVYNYNRFQACRFGLEGVVVHPKTYAQQTIRDDILSTLEKITPSAAALDCLPALKVIKDIVTEGNDATFLRTESSGIPERIVMAALDRFRH